MYQLRRANENEMAIAMNLIDQAKSFLRAQGIDQWQSGYPDAACIQNDIQSGKGHFMLDHTGNVVAYMCIDWDGEPAYSTLRGTWLTEESARYAVVHRLAIDPACRGKGLASKAFDLIQALCIEQHATSIRIDTDADNAIMKHLLGKNGYAYCGVIRFDNSDKIAYEKLLGDHSRAFTEKSI